jgi:hypothetical protein
LLPGTYHFSCILYGFSGLPQSCQHIKLMEKTEVRAVKRNKEKSLHTLIGRYSLMDRSKDPATLR